MLLKVDFSALHEVRQHVKGIGVTLSQVALNDSIMVVAFAPLVAFLLGSPASSCPGTHC